MRFIRREFIADDSGAVTVDWVVLCAGIVGMTVVIATGMSDKAVTLGGNVSSYMTDKSPK